MRRIYGEALVGVIRGERCSEQKPTVLAGTYLMRAIQLLTVFGSIVNAEYACVLRGLGGALPTSESLSDAKDYIYALRKQLLTGNQKSDIPIFETLRSENQGGNCGDGQGGFPWLANNVPKVSDPGPGSPAR
jgi:hypothetical protein